MKELKKKLKRLLLPLWYHGFCKPRILRRIRRQDRITVVFFTMNVAMWKYDGFFKLLQEDPRFHPVIVSFLIPTDKEEYRRYVQQSMQDFFEAKGYPFYASYDFETGKYLDIKQLHPDILFYAQPYESAPEPYRTKHFLRTCLFSYIPYCYNMEDLPLFYNQPFMKLAWRMFFPTEHHARMVAKYSRLGGRHVVVAGYPMADALLSREPADGSVWKERDPLVKRVIWAPHHSVLPKDFLDYSRFLELADTMVALAEKYRGRVQFAFKPHPRLKPKLMQHPDWGVERTEAFYRLWKEMPNTVFVEGDYVDLFRTSDALIHDCSSFMGEYLFMNKPVAFLGNRGAVTRGLNDFAKACLEQHYQLDAREDIERFLEEVVLGGDDPMEPSRRTFRETVLATDGQSVARRIYDAFRAGIQG
ncbi:MAG: CDP-glycerol glycerophosphotransferase family protein [Bacteroidales bacterium]|nr:CDP-glycerol glycerophosphotransferase family protein [Bacteroidales bacterium]